MQPLSNRQFAASLANVALLLGLTVFFYGETATQNPLVMFVAISFSLAVMVGVDGLLGNLEKSNEWWSKAISPKAGSLFVNAIALIWLGFVGLILFVFLYAKKNSLFFACTVAIAALAAIFAGVYLRRFFSAAMLSFAISFLVALVIVVIAFAVGLG